MGANVGVPLTVTVCMCDHSCHRSKCKFNLHDDDTGVAGRVVAVIAISGANAFGIPVGIFVCYLRRTGTDCRYPHHNDSKSGCSDNFNNNNNNNNNDNNNSETDNELLIQNSQCML